MAEEPSTVLVLGSVVHTTLDQTLEISLASPCLLLVLLREKALLTLPTGLVLVSPERDCFLLLLRTCIPIQLAVLVASGAARFRLLVADQKSFLTREKQAIVSTIVMSSQVQKKE